MVSYALPCEGSKIMHIQLRFPVLPYTQTEISLDSLNLFSRFAGERPTFFVIFGNLSFFFTFVN